MGPDFFWGCSKGELIKMIFGCLEKITTVFGKYETDGGVWEMADFFPKNGELSGGIGS